MLRYHPTFEKATVVSAQDPVHFEGPQHSHFDFSRSACTAEARRSLPEEMAEHLATTARNCARFRKGLFVAANRAGVADAICKALMLLSPDLTICGIWSGCVTAGTSPDLVAALNGSGAEVVCLCLGDAAEHDWIARHRGALQARTVLGVGSAFAEMACETFLDEADCRRLPAVRTAGRAAMPGLGRRLRAMRKPVTQRVLDLAVAGTALLAVAPVMAVLALAVRLDSAGPAIFPQTRIGKGGQPFTIYKFRTMHCAMTEADPACLGPSDRDGPCFKARKDSRITRIGRLLRRTSLDELPQIVNVLKGDMSIVGPRPGLAREVAAYRPQALRRLAVRPGITGIWQVSGRADVSFDRMIRMDLRYVRTRSVLGDLRIIARTFGAVITGRGAY